MKKVKLIRVSLEHKETLYIIKSPDIFGLTAMARTKEEVLTMDNSRSPWIQADA